jgi:hypothetical protein
MPRYSSSSATRTPDTLAAKRENDDLVLARLGKRELAATDK